MGWYFHPTQGETEAHPGLWPTAGRVVTEVPRTSLGLPTPERLVWHLDFPRSL